jgi:hypothetical protein
VPFPSIHAIKKLKPGASQSCTAIYFRLSGLIHILGALSTPTFALLVSIKLADILIFNINGSGQE